jgi:hypothetical protein
MARASARPRVGCRGRLRSHGQKVEARKLSACEINRERERERRAGNQERERSVGEGDEDDAEQKNIALLELKIE